MTVALLIVAVRPEVVETTAVKSTVSVPELNVQLLMVTPVIVVNKSGTRTRLVIEVGVPEAIVNVAQPYSVVGGIAEIVYVAGEGVTEEVTVDEYVIDASASAARGSVDSKITLKYTVSMVAERDQLFTT